MKKAVWNIYEREDLTNTVSECLFADNAINWETIRQKFPDKSIHQCQQAYRNFTRTDMPQNGQYVLTEEDTQELLVFTEGKTRDWVQLRRKMPQVPMTMLLHESRRLAMVDQQQQESLVDELIRFLGSK